MVDAIRSVEEGSAFDLSEGVVQTLAIPHPFSRTELVPSRHYDVVISTSLQFPRNMTERRGIDTEMELPDPPLEWLKTGFLRMVPSLIRGDVVSAAVAFGAHALESLGNQIERLLGGDRRFRAEDTVAT